MFKDLKEVLAMLGHLEFKVRIKFDFTRMILTFFPIRHSGAERIGWKNRTDGYEKFRKFYFAVFNSSIF